MKLLIGSSKGTISLAGPLIIGAFLKHPPGFCSLEVIVRCRQKIPFGDGAWINLTVDEATELYTQLGDVLKKGMEKETV